MSRTGRVTCALVFAAAAAVGAFAMPQGEPGSPEGSRIRRLLQGLWGERGSPAEPEPVPIPHDGRFVIARIRYTVGGGGFEGGFGRRGGGGAASDGAARASRRGRTTTRAPSATS